MVATDGDSRLRDAAWGRRKRVPRNGGGAARNPLDSLAMSDPPAINPFVNEDGGGYYDGEGDYVPGPDDFAGEPDLPVGWGQPLDPERAAKRRFATRGVLNRVGERDGWVCQICGGPIDGRLRPPDPLAPVADHHPVPHADGGPTSADNLRIAHARCNDQIGARHALTS